VLQHAQWFQCRNTAAQFQTGLGLTWPRGDRQIGEKLQQAPSCVFWQSRFSTGALIHKTWITTTVMITRFANRWNGWEWPNPETNTWWLEKQIGHISSVPLARQTSSIALSDNWVPLNHPKSMGLSLGRPETHRNHPSSCLDRRVAVRRNSPLATNHQRKVSLWICIEGPSPWWNLVSQIVMFCKLKTTSTHWCPTSLENNK